jgi:hypothetical protein
MLICRQKYLKSIKERLQAKGVRCEIEVRFAQYKFKSAANTAVLYHDCKLDDLVRLFRFSSEFTFEDKLVLPIYITDYIRIEQADGFNLKDVESAAEWLRLEFPHEKLRLYEFKVQRRREYFLETESKLSTLLIYYVFQSFGIKVTLKNPLGLSKMSEDERKDVFKQVVYSSSQNCESKEAILNIDFPSL